MERAPDRPPRGVPLTTVGSEALAAAWRLWEQAHEMSLATLGRERVERLMLDLRAIPALAA